MAYYGYIPKCKEFLSAFCRPRMLEVGVEHGTTFLTLAIHLVRTKASFVAVGIDILLLEHVKLQIMLIDRTNDQIIELYENDSLKLLPEMILAQERFDLVLLDGDH